MALTSFFLRVAAALTLLAALSTHVHASPAITVPYNITLGVPQQLKIVYKIDDDSDLRKRYNAYRVFLALEPPGWGWGPVCWLAYAEDLETTEVNVTIPADVAPDKSRYRISTSLIKKGTESVNGYSYSSRYTLYGANGNWSQRELDGWTISDEDTASCQAFGCVRDCQERYYSGDKTQYSNGTGDAEADNCISQCEKNLNPASSAAMSLLPSAFLMAAAICLVQMFIS